MELRIFTEPQQGASYSDLLRMARCAEDAGYGAFFRSDHYQHMGEVDPNPGPSDAWITLAGLARDTTTIRLGTLVTPATFRYPGPLAVSVAGVDEMSGGRIELGLGAGWYEAEHDSYAIPFPDLGERFDRYEEQLEIITGLWDAQGRYSFAGKHYSVTDSPALPKPVQSPHPPVIVGGGGKKRTPRLAARYADEFNMGFASLEETVEQYRRVARACTEIGRDPAALTYSAALVACVGADEATVRRRADVIGRDAAELRAGGLAGSAAEVVETIGRWAEAGVQRMYLQMLDISDLEQVEYIASEVAGKL